MDPPLPYVFPAVRPSNARGPQSGRAPFNSETSRNLLMCLVWVLRWAERGALAGAAAELPPARRAALLALIDLCFKCQEYKVTLT